MTSRSPSLFLSHGAPDFALEPGQIGRRLGQLGQALPRPQAVLVVSAHWESDAIELSGATWPETVHDFRGFDPALHEFHYRAPGHPELARSMVERLDDAGWTARLNRERGLDHGTWVPLLHLYPDASVPVVQVSLLQDMSAEQALALGRALGTLASEGVLVVGSGSLTHSLADFFGHRREGEAAARAFRDWIRSAVEQGRIDDLLAALERAPQAARIHPTPEHYLPLLVAAGAGDPDRPAHWIEGELVHGVLAMDAIVFGIDAALQEDLSRRDF